MTTFLVSIGNGYAVRGSRGYEIHQSETLDLGWCCDRGCGLRYLDALGVPSEVTRDHPLGHGAGDYIEMRETDTRGDMAVYSWGDYPCAETPSHEYCPACGALTLHGTEDEDSEERHCRDYGDDCTWPAYVAPDEIMPYADLDEFVRGYVECALWSSSVEDDYGAANDMAGDTSMQSAGFSADDIDDDAMASMREDCDAFARHHRLDVDEYISLMGTWHGSDTVRGADASYSGAEQAGADFWLSRNGHGGYLDRGNDAVFGRLQDAARTY